jgi:hypothetical protein
VKRRRLWSRAAVPPSVGEVLGSLLLVEAIDAWLATDLTESMRARMERSRRSAICILRGEAIE